MSKLTIQGEETPLDQFKFGIGVVRTNTEIVAEAFSDLTEADDQGVRAARGAVVFVGAAASDLAKRALELAESEDGAIAASIAGDLALDAFAVFNKLRDRFDVLDLGQDSETIDEGDSTTRGAALRVRFDQLQTRRAQLTSRAHNGNSEVKLIIGVIDSIFEGLEQQVQLVEGTYKGDISDEAVRETIKRNKDQAIEAGWSEEKAEAEIAKALGSTFEEQKETLRGMVVATVAMGTPGTTAGAIRAGEHEAELAQKALDRLETIAGEAGL